ncbi:MAG: ABC transporter substrate-binding protein [Armatimonadota bacterium]|nr:ABC transporter substrate-binding protein [Armatimonadota bacterium]MDR7585798.1 ABC transporter substrate-binding protein [Armatimonadota bacterium]
MRRRSRGAVTVLVGLAAALVAGVPGLGAPAAVPSGEITLYTSESEDDVNALVQDFTRRTPGVRVQIFRAGSGPVVSKLQAELQAGRIQADVIWFADIDFFRSLAGRDLLLPYRPPAGGRVPAPYHYEGDRMHEVRLIFNVVAFNTNHVRFRPSSWWDLTLPRYRGRVGMPSPFVSGAAFNHVGTFASLREFGWDYYRKLRDNGAVVLRSNGDVAQKLASGEVSIAQIVDFFVRNLKREGSPVDHIWPREGALLVPTPVAIIKTTGNVPAAQAFVNYLYTPEAQRLFVQRSYIPVVPGIPYPEGVPDISELRVLHPNLAYIDRHREEIRRIFGELFGVTR